MRSFNRVWLPRLRYLGALLWVFGFILLTPLLIVPFRPEITFSLTTILPFIVPALISLLVGGLLNRSISFRPLSGTGALMVVSWGWLLVSIVGAIPFVLGLHISFLNAFFEATSGFTTTGITLLSGLDAMPPHILFWRSLTQWIGGLGILTFFLVLVFRGETSHKLFGAESHKIMSERPAPGMFHTLRILWSIYGLFTALTALILLLEGVSWFDALNHSLTALSTGGFSTHDASIDYFRRAGFGNYRLIEYTLIGSMALGGMSFVVHYRVLRGEIRALWDGIEIRLFWKIIAFSAAVVTLSHMQEFGFSNFFSTIRYSLFQVVSLVTSTGYATKDIGALFFPVLAKQIFLLLMVIGGSVGSTAGGIKILRIGILWKMLKRRVAIITQPRRTVRPLVIDGDILPVKEVRRISALFFAWLLFLVLGGMITASFSDLNAIASFSGMFSALGNMGPSYIPLEVWPELHPVVKITYIIGMLAGRLEILPVMVFMSRRAWR